MKGFRSLGLHDTRRTPPSHQLPQLSRSFQRSSLLQSRSSVPNRLKLPRKPTRPSQSQPQAPQARPNRPQTRFNSTQTKTNSRPRPDPTSQLGSPASEPNPASLSLTQRFRKLSREYGWSAVGVYFALSALDFPFCFAAVRLLGTERIGHWEHVIVGYAWRMLTMDGRLGSGSIADPHDEAAVGQEKEGTAGIVAISQESGNIIEQASEGQGWTWGVEEAQEANQKSDASESSFSPVPFDW